MGPGCEPVDPREGGRGEPVHGVCAGVAGRVAEWWPWFGYCGDHGDGWARVVGETRDAIVPRGNDSAVCAVSYWVFGKAGVATRSSSSGNSGPSLRVSPESDEARPLTWVMVPGICRL